MNKRIQNFKKKKKIVKSFVQNDSTEDRSYPIQKLDFNSDSDDEKDQKMSHPPETPYKFGPNSMNYNLFEETPVTFKSHNFSLE